MSAEKEEQIFVRRLIELAGAAYKREIKVYSDFLNLNEVSIFHRVITELPVVPFLLWGGYPSAERVRICFCGDLEGGRYEITDGEFHDTSAFPIECIKIAPQNIKFAQDLTHRDFLGAILNLGVDRCKVGDILIHNKEALVFFDSAISVFFSNNLIKVKHTNVKISIENTVSLHIEPKYEVISGTVSSVRLDSLIALAFRCSRSSMTDYILGGKVFVNGKETLSASYIPRQGEHISVRGFGKFTYRDSGNITKKGRIPVKLLKYI